MSNFPVAAATLPLLMRNFGPILPVAGLPFQTAVRTTQPAAVWINTNVAIENLRSQLQGAGFSNVAPYLSETSLRLRGYQFVRLGPTRLTVRGPAISDGTSNTISFAETTTAVPTAPLANGASGALVSAASQPILFV